MKNNRKKIRTISLVSIFTSMMCIISQLAIPMPSAVPITLQVFIIIFTGYFLKATKAMLSVFIYICLGAVGLPVFAGFNGGIHVLVGPTGGFIWGFLLIALLCSLFNESKLAIPIGILSVVFCHALGVLQYSFVSEVHLGISFLTVSAPYILKDLIFVPLAYLLSVKMKKIIKMKEE